MEYELQDINSNTILLNYISYSTNFLILVKFEIFSRYPGDYKFVKLIFFFLQITLKKYLRFSDVNLPKYETDQFTIFWR